VLLELVGCVVVGETELAMLFVEVLHNILNLKLYKELIIIKSFLKINVK